MSPAWLGTCMPRMPKLVTTKAPMSRYGCPLLRRGTAHAAHAAILTRVEASVSGWMVVPVSDERGSGCGGGLGRCYKLL